MKINPDGSREGTPEELYIYQQHELKGQTAKTATAECTTVCPGLQNQANDPHDPQKEEEEHWEEPANISDEQECQLPVKDVGEEEVEEEEPIVVINVITAVKKFMKEWIGLPLPEESCPPTHGFEVSKTPKNLRFLVRAASGYDNYLRNLNTGKSKTEKIQPTLTNKETGFKAWFGQTLIEKKTARVNQGIYTDFENDLGYLLAEAKKEAIEQGTYRHLREDKVEDYKIARCKVQKKEELTSN